VDNNFTEAANYYFWVSGQYSGGIWQVFGGADDCGKEPIPMVFFDNGEPSGDGSCVHMKANGKLNDCPCGDGLWFVCETHGTPTCWP
jgi:hypothetical protein